MRVSYEEFELEYGSQFRGSFEKCNIWPLEDSTSARKILSEEITEARVDMTTLDSYAATALRQSNLSTHDTEYIKGLAISTILELLQVLAVLKKYDGVLNND